jgi:hypothetical protein
MASMCFTLLKAGTLPVPDENCLEALEKVYYGSSSSNGRGYKLHLSD